MAEVLSIIWRVNGILGTYVSVDGVGRVSLTGLIRTVSSSLRVRGSVSDNSENRETGGLSCCSVSSNREESSSSSNDLSENLTTSLSIDSGRNACVISLLMQKELYVR
jgi:hypothetical protein